MAVWFVLNISAMTREQGDAILKDLA